MLVRPERLTDVDTLKKKYEQACAYAFALERKNDALSERLADQARAAYKEALLAARDNSKPADLFRIASEHPIAFETWMRDLDDWHKLELLRRLMQGTSYRVPSC
jgi:hypothetical protein